MKLIRMLVACHYRSGVPGLFPFIVVCTQEQYDNGDHYEAAKEALYMYEGPYVVIDENDDVSEEVLSCFDWIEAPVVDISGEPIDANL